MNRREQLIDNYEDALFAVLMDKVAEEEGAKLREENQRLQEDPAAEVPERVDMVARQTIRKAFAGQNRRSALHVAKRVLNTVAMIVLICSAIFATAYAAFPEVRVKTLNLLIQSSDVASKLSLVSGDEENGLSDDEAEQNIICGYSIPRPPEFSMVGKEEDKHGGWVKFEKDSGEIVRISISTAKTEYVDTEGTAHIEDIMVHGYSGIMIEKGDRISAIWSEEDHGYYVMVVCTSLNQSFVLSTAESIVFMGP